jgi:hypothetical protein
LNHFKAVYLATEQLQTTSKLFIPPIVFVERSRYESLESNEKFPNISPVIWLFGSLMPVTLLVALFELRASYSIPITGAVQAVPVPLGVSVTAPQEEKTKNMYTS